MRRESQVLSSVLEQNLRREKRALSPCVPRRAQDGDLLYVETRKDVLKPTEIGIG